AQGVGREQALRHLLRPHPVPRDGVHDALARRRVRSDIARDVARATREREHPRGGRRASDPACLHGVFSSPHLHEGTSGATNATVPGEPLTPWFRPPSLSDRFAGHKSVAVARPPFLRGARWAQHAGRGSPPHSPRFWPWAPLRPRRTPSRGPAP